MTAFSDEWFDLQIGWHRSLGFFFAGSSESSYFFRWKIVSPGVLDLLGPPRPERDVRQKPKLGAKRKFPLSRRSAQCFGIRTASGHRQMDVRPRSSGWRCRGRANLGFVSKDYEAWEETDHGANGQSVNHACLGLCPPPRTARSGYPFPYACPGFSFPRGHAVCRNHSVSPLDNRRIP